METKVLTVGKKRELLAKTAWDYKDIMAFAGCTKMVAYDIKKQAISECKGKVPYNSRVVFSDSVLALMHTTRERELDLINKSTSRKKKNQDESEVHS